MVAESSGDGNNCMTVVFNCIIIILNVLRRGYSKGEKPHSNANAGNV